MMLFYVDFSLSADDTGNRAALLHRPFKHLHVLRRRRDNVLKGVLPSQSLIFVETKQFNECLTHTLFIFNKKGEIAARDIFDKNGLTKAVSSVCLE